MVITRTPFRISFFGGGSDYPAWYRENGGAVLATTINKYCYITCRHLPPFFEHKHRIVYSRVENVKTIDEVQHPAVRAVLQWANVNNGLEIHHDGDLPARSGLGSSSAFTVGLVHALRGLEGEGIAKNDLARHAIHIEQDLIGENVGSQDQISAAFGGLNRISFRCDNSFEVAPVAVCADRVEQLGSHLMLLFTGLSRVASEIAGSKIKNLRCRAAELGRMMEMVDEAVAILKDDDAPIEEFGRLLGDSWMNKKRLADCVSTPVIDQLYDEAIRAGAIGGKILGAGGGGFLLLFAKPECQPMIRERLKSLVHVPFKFENLGSQIVLNQSNGL